jgi:hypothetical protein
MTGETEWLVAAAVVLVLAVLAIYYFFWYRLKCGTGYAACASGKTCGTNGYCQTPTASGS